MIDPPGDHPLPHPKLPTQNPLIDPLFLIRMPLIDDRRIRLGKRQPVDAEYQSADC